MSERKVATRQERLMFEQIIREDMKNGIQREIIDSPQVQNNSKSVFIGKFIELLRERLKKRLKMTILDRVTPS